MSKDLPEGIELYRPFSSEDENDYECLQGGE
jgi:hypothetical protein